MRWLCFAIAFFISSTAAAQPVSFQLEGQVPIGKKPRIQVTATEAVTDLRIELDRDDGKRFTVRHPALAKGKSVLLAIGDGAPGKASYKGTITAQVGGERWSDQLVFDTRVTAPIKVTYDAEHLDLDKRELQIKLSRPADKAELTVIGDDGKQLATATVTLTGQAANTWLPIRWAQPPNTRVMIMKLRVSASDGVASNVELIPWSVTIDHEDVNFATDSAVIEPSETAKLDASVAKIKDAIQRSERFMKMKLYVAGHTDTVGASPKNRKLSFDRALAIATYFKKRGIAIPIVVAGFGEDVLKVKTGDNTDERRNRRADYVLGPAAGAPPFKGPYLAARASWKQLR